MRIVERAPNPRLQIYPAAVLGVPRIIQIDGGLFYPCLRPFRHQRAFGELTHIGLGGAVGFEFAAADVAEEDAVRHDFAETGVGMAYAELYFLVVGQFERAFAQPRTHIQGCVGHFAGRMVIRTDIGGIFLNIRNFFGKFFLAHGAGIGEVAVAFCALAAGKVIALVAPCVGNQAVKHFAAHTG